VSVRCDLEEGGTEGGRGRRGLGTSEGRSLFELTYDPNVPRAPEGMVATTLKSMKM